MTQRIRSFAKGLRLTGVKLARGISAGARIARRRQLTQNQIRRAKKGLFRWKDGLLRDNRSETHWKVDGTGNITKTKTVFGGSHGIPHPVSTTITTYDPSGKRIDQKTRRFTRRRLKPK